MIPSKHICRSMLRNYYSETGNRFALPRLRRIGLRHGGDRSLTARISRLVCAGS
jgi:hypothetical protein